MSVMDAVSLVADPQGTRLGVRAQPNARRCGIVGEHAGAVRIAVAAAPENGQANAAVTEALARALDCRSSQVVLVCGPTSRSKRFLILGLDPETVRSRLGAAHQRTP